MRLSVLKQHNQHEKVTGNPAGKKIGVYNEIDLLLLILKRQCSCYLSRRNIRYLRTYTHAFQETPSVTFELLRLPRCLCQEYRELGFPNFRCCQWQVLVRAHVQAQNCSACECGLYIVLSNPAYVRNAKFDVAMIRWRVVVASPWRVRVRVRVRMYPVSTLPISLGCEFRECTLCFCYGQGVFDDVDDEEGGTRCEEGGKQLRLCTDVGKMVVRHRTLLHSPSSGIII